MKYNYDYTENDYKTPPELYRMALRRLGLEKFGLDACCSEFNIPSWAYYKQEGFFMEGGEKLNNNDGLTGGWFHFTWCNPPFNECKKWIEKAYYENKERGITICMLLPVRTETKYWHDYILHNPNVEIVWLRKGYKFLDKNNQEMGIFKNALALVFFLRNEKQKP